MNRKFDDILNECLERLLVKGETVEQCLQSYPEHAAELKPLLQTALASKKALEVKPSAEFKARARYQFRTALAESATKKSRPSFAWLPGWATTLILALGLLLAGSGTVAAANYSMPDSPLYPVKIATEQVQLSLTRSDEGKEELDIKLADKRVAEIIYLADKGDAKRIEATTQQLNKNLEGLTALATEAATVATTEAGTLAAPSTTGKTGAQNPPTPSLQASNDTGKAASDKAREQRLKLREEIMRSASSNPAVLKAALEKAPESSKSALRKTINILMERYQKALEALND
jgi:hypothetical protein